MLEKIKNLRNNSDFSKLLGIKITELKEGYAVGEMHCKNDLYNVINSIHGGAIFSLADSITGACANSHGIKMTTSSANFNYLSPAIECKKLICIAKEIKFGKNLCIYDAEVKDENGKLIAKGTFTYFNLKIPYENN